MGVQERYEYIPPNETRRLFHEGLRESIGNVIVELDGVLPESREKSLALTKLEEALFWANAAVARHVD